MCYISKECKAFTSLQFLEPTVYWSMAHTKKAMINHTVWQIHLQSLDSAKLRVKGIKPHCANAKMWMSVKHFQKHS